MTAKKTSTTKSTSKSDFIRQQPATASATEVVEKAKVAGLKFDASLVYKVRRRASAKDKTKMAAARKASTTTKGTTTKPVKTKADFVRAHRNLSPKEVVDQAKVEGIKLDVGYVYNVRGSDKISRKKKREATRGTTTGSNGSSAPRTAAAMTSAEDLLRAVAAEIGLRRAMEILAGERARVRAVIGG
jgi:hypothetical protein